MVPQIKLTHTTVQPQNQLPFKDIEPPESWNANKDSIKMCTVKGFKPLVFISVTEMSVSSQKHWVSNWNKKKLASLCRHTIHEQGCNE